MSVSPLDCKSLEGRVVSVLITVVSLATHPVLGMD